MKLQHLLVFVIILAAVLPQTGLARDFIIRDVTNPSNVFFFVQGTTGRVGIATTTPGSPLTVAGVIYSSTGGFKFPDGTTQTTAGGGGGTNFWTLSGTSLYPTSTAYNVGVGTASLDANYKITTSGGGIKAESTSQPAGYFSSASGYGLIVNSGNVGIGTTGPGKKLEVKDGDLRVSQTGGWYLDIGAFDGTNVRYDTNASIHRFNASGSFWGNVSSDNGFVGSRYGLSVGPNYYGTTPPGSTGAIIEGNVGIGTTAPATKLHVDDSTNAGAQLTLSTPTGGGGNTGIVFRPYQTPAQWTNPAQATILTIDNNYSADIVFSTKNQGAIGNALAERVRITNTGNVGIGTTGPGAKLDVVIGAVAATGLRISKGANYDDRFIRLTNSNTGGNEWDIQNVDANGNFQIYDNTAGTMALAIQKSTGNVGIGTTTPAYKLTVVGTSQFSQPVFVGTPVSDSHAATKSYVDSAVVAGGDGSFTTITVSGTSTLSGNFSFGGAAITNLNMNNKDIVGVNKITVSTIDPLYQIGAKKYATYVASIAGGVKEEYVGRATLVRKSEIRNPKSETNSKSQNPKSLEFSVPICHIANRGSLISFNEIGTSCLEFAGPSYEYVIDFNKLKEGSDLWVWYKTVDFSRDNVEVLATAYGVPVPIAYTIDGNKITFRADILNTKYSIPDTGINFSYRLIGKRFDWRKHPTRVESDEAPSFIIP